MSDRAWAVWLARFRTRIVDVVAVKGKTIGVSVYEILSRKDDDTNAEVHDLVVAKCETKFSAGKAAEGADERLIWLVQILARV